MKQSGRKAIGSQAEVKKQNRCVCCHYSFKRTFYLLGMQTGQSPAVLDHPRYSSILWTFVWQMPYEKKKYIGLHHLPIARAVMGSLEQFWFTVSGQWTVHWASQVFAARREAGQTGTWWGRSFSTIVSNVEWSGRNSTLWILSSLSLATSNRFLYRFAHFYRLLAQNRHSS